MTALADPDAARQRLLAKTFRDAELHSDIESLLSSHAVDAVAVCLPPDLQAEAALSVLRAGRHLFVEKPPALTRIDAERLVEAGVRSPGIARVGFNLRAHRATERVKEVLRAGRLGTVRRVRTRFTHRPDGPAAGHWRRSPHRGGDPILDLGIHHFDLLRHLFGAELDTVTARGSAEGRASVDAALANGVRASLELGESADEANEIAIEGDAAVLEVGFYDRFGVRLISRPRRALFERATGLARDALAVPAEGRGGPFLASYRRQWERFARAVGGGHPEGATLADGERALAAALAAISSREPATPDAARVRRPGRPPLSGPPSPRLTVVTVSPEGWKNVRDVLAALRAQTVRGALEVLLVVPRRNGLPVPEAETTGFAAFRVVECGPIRSTGAAIAAGVRAASAPYVAYAEEHSVWDARWAEMLLDAHSRGYAAVSGAIGNANPRTRTSWACLYSDFGPWVAPGREGERETLPSHHTSYETDVLLGYGSRLDGMLECEGVLQGDLRRRGRRLHFRTDAVSAHWNISRPASFLQAGFLGGRIYGAARARDARWSWPRRLFFAAASPLVPFLLARRRAAFLRNTASQERPAGLLPFLLIHGFAHVAGEVAGVLFGAGDAPRQRSLIELRRHRYLTPDESGAIGGPGP